MQGYFAGSDGVCRFRFGLVSSSYAFFFSCRGLIGGVLLREVWRGVSSFCSILHTAWDLWIGSLPFFLDFWGCFCFFGPLPSFCIISLLIFGAISLEVAMLMAESAFEGQLFVVQLLIVVPITHRDLDRFW